MMKSLMMLCILNSSFIIVCFHPISFGIILLTQTILFSFCMRIITNSSWMPLTMFLVMVGGLMILFLYITSICSNKKPYFIKPSILQMSYLFITMMFLSKSKNLSNLQESLDVKNLFNMEFTKLFLPMNIFSSNFMFLYLLFMLIIMIEILAVNKTPMRKKY